MASGNATERLVDAAALERFVAEVFERAGAPRDEAERVADALVSADARGMTSHGVMRVPMYMKKVRAGGFKVGTKGKILRETASIILLDGEDGLGQVITWRAMEEAIRKARDAGAGIVGVLRSNHFGEGAYYALHAIKNDMIGLLTTNGSSNTPAHGGRTMVAGNLPLTVGVPTDKELPILLDMAMCASSKGKIAYAAKKGERIPPGWAVDSNGQPTDDPQKVLDGGWILPIGGYKGWGLILILDILSGVLTGARLGLEITDLFTGEPSSPQGLGHFVMAINVEAFMPVAEFKRRMDARIRSIKQSELLPGVTEILMPGERELKLERERRKNGIPLSVNVLDQIAVVAKELGVAAKLP
jgi:LDH2 family malate/lactate/ureidoglycolate dehydrogenase